MLCLQGYHCFINYRFVTPLLCSRPRLSLPLFVTSLYYLFKVCIVSLPVCYVSAQFEISTVSSSVCYVAMLSPRGFLCFIICLLRLGQSRLQFVTSPWFRLKVSLSVCYITAVFWTLTVSSSVLLRHYAFNSWFPTFYCFMICLLHQCSVLGFDCLFFYLLRHYAFSSWYPLFHYQFVT